MSRSHDDKHVYYITIESGATLHIHCSDDAQVNNDIIVKGGGIMITSIGVEAADDEEPSD